jgi:flagellar biosynthesis protein FlhG
MTKILAHSHQFDESLVIDAAKQKKIWAIGGGKGGVGKSFVISNLAISLARAGKKVIAIDLDLGGANLHTSLGCDIPRNTLNDFLVGQCGKLEDLLVKTNISNLSFISGANDSVGIANIGEREHKLLLNKILHLPADYILVDLGAGTNHMTLDYFLLASKPTVVLTPEPTSIENAYRFIKSSYFRWIYHVERHLGLKSIIDQAMDHKNTLGIKTPRDLVDKIAKLHPDVGARFREEVQKFAIYLVMNQVRTQNDVEIGHSVRTVCKKYFGVDTHYVGYLEYDNAVWQAIRKRKPLILEFPYSNLVSEFSLIAKNLDDYERHPRSNILRTP